MPSAKLAAPTSSATPTQAPTSERKDESQSQSGSLLQRLAEMKTLPAAPSINAGEDIKLGGPSISLLVGTAVDLAPHDVAYGWQSQESPQAWRCFSCGSSDMTTPGTQTAHTEQTLVATDCTDEDAGYEGWPCPSAVDCIVADVRRLCLPNPALVDLADRCIEDVLSGCSLDQSQAEEVPPYARRE